VSVGVTGEPAGSSTVITNGGNGLYELAVKVPENAPPSLSTIVISTRSKAATRSEAIFLEVVRGPVPTPVVLPPPVLTSPPATMPVPSASVAFSIRADTAETTVATGVTAAFGIMVDRSSGFVGELTFSAAGFPAG
jgi:hypothetical protein